MKITSHIYYTFKKPIIFSELYDLCRFFYYVIQICTDKFLMYKNFVVNLY